MRKWEREESGKRKERRGGWKGEIRSGGKEEDGEKGRQGKKGKWTLNEK